MRVRTGHGTTHWFQIGKGVCQCCILSPCLFNLYADYIVRNAGLEEAQARIKILGRNINNLRYADDTTLMAKNEDCGIQPNHFMQIDGESMETVTDFLGAPKSLQMVATAMKLKHACSLEEKL